MTNRISISTAQNVDIEFEAAGIGDRAVAALIDYWILIAYLLAVFLLLPTETPPAIQVILSLPYFFYFLISEIAFNGQSIGKKARRIKVTRLDGRQPGLGDYLLRWLFRLIEIDLTGGLIALVTMFVRQNGQRLGDVAAGTAVVKLRPQVQLSDTLYAPVTEDHRINHDRIDALDEEDIHLVRDVMEALKKDPAQTATLGGRLKETLEAKMGVESPMEPFEFLETLLLDYNQVHRHGADGTLSRRADS